MSYAVHYSTEVTGLAEDPEVQAPAPQVNIEVSPIGDVMADDVIASFEQRSIAEVVAERIRQDDKWGDQSHLPPAFWLAILMEEVGEVGEEVEALDGFGKIMTKAIIEVGQMAKANCEDSDVNLPSQYIERPERAAEELIQVAAVCVAWAENIYSK